jgi:hypothetical protein
MAKYAVWGSGEFALPFGNFDVNIPPTDDVMEATGDLMNEVKSLLLLK